MAPSFSGSYLCRRCAAEIIGVYAPGVARLHDDEAYYRKEGISFNTNQRGKGIDLRDKSAGQIVYRRKSESGTTEAPLPAKKISSDYLKRKPNWVSMPHLKVFR